LPSAPGRIAPARTKGRSRPEKQRSLFAGLKLRVSPSPEPRPGDRPERESGQAEQFDPPAARARGATPLEAAIDRYARAYQSIDQHRRSGLPVLDMQRRELGAAGGQLDQVHAGLHDLMRSTLHNDPATLRAMTEFFRPGARPPSDPGPDARRGGAERPGGPGRAL
jgi:hypothetical protein